jgi:hypothetical protein
MLSEDALRLDLKTAMLAKDRVRTRVLRAILAATKNTAIDKKVSVLAEADVLAIVKREVKQRNESLEFARKGGRDDAIAELNEDLAVLEVYLPKQLGEAELRTAIAAIVASGASAVGPIMKELSTQYPGRYDGKLASQLAQEFVRK